MVTHLTVSEIASFVDGNFENIDKFEVAQHLRECERCRREYQEAVSAKGLWLNSREEFQPDKNLVAEGMAIAGRVDGRTGVIRHWWKSGRGKFSVAAAGVAVVAVFTALLWFSPDETGDSLPAYDQTISIVFNAAKNRSSQARFVLPRTERWFDPHAPVYRSGPEVDDDSMTESLLALIERRSSGSGTRDDLFWLVTGFLVTSQLLEAKNCVNDALNQYPGDPEFTSLYAIIECSRNNCVHAEQLLEPVVREFPDNMLSRLNLAVVQIQRGKKPEGRRNLQEIVDKEPDSPLSIRAQTLLEKL